MCISECKEKNKTMQYRLLTAIWCLNALILNLIQIYSFYNATRTTMYILRLYTGFSIVVASVATYALVVTSVNSYYQTRHEIIYIPVWFKQSWDVILILNTSTLFILYTIAFSYNNSLCIDIHWFVCCITFWFGSISTLSAMYKVKHFLDNTIVEIEKSNTKKEHNANNYESYYNTFKKINKLRKMKYKLLFLLISAMGLLIPITYKMVITIIKIINIAKGKQKIQGLETQQFGSFIQYFGFATFLCALDVELIVWNFESFKSSSHSFFHVCCLYGCCCIDDLGELDPMYTKWSPDQDVKNKMQQTIEIKMKHNKIMEESENCIDDSYSCNNNCQNPLKKVTNSDITTLNSGLGHQYNDIIIVENS